MPPPPAWLPPVALALTVALPALVLAANAVGSGWRPVSLDLSLELLRTWEVGGRHTPLVGAYSRFGWDHPGPLLFVASAPAVRLLGAEGLLVTAGVVNAVAAAGAVLAAHRTAGLRLALPAAVAVSVMMHAVTGAGLTDPWNPYVAVLPFVAYLLCVWGAVNGDRVLLVAAVVAGSWCVQAHLGYLPIAVAAAFLAAGLRAARSRVRAEPDPLPRRWIVAAVAVGLALWLPPVADQVLSGHGNLGDLLAFARDGSNPAEIDAEPVGWSPAVDTMSGMVTPPAPWTRPALPDQYLSVPDGSPATAVVVVGLAAVGGLAWWRRRPGPAALVGLSGALVAVSVVAMARASDDLFGYLIRWSWGVAALVWIAAAWALIELLAPVEDQVPVDRADRVDQPDPVDPVDPVGRPERRRTWLVPALAAVAVPVVVVLGLRTVADGTNDRFTGDPAVEAVTGMSRQLRAELDPDVTYELVANSSWHYLVAPGIAVDLITHGQNLVVTPDLAKSFKPWRVPVAGGAYPQIVLVPTAEVPDWREEHPTARRLAVHVPRRPAEHARLATSEPHEAWLLEPEPAPEPPRSI